MNKNLIFWVLIIIMICSFNFFGQTNTPVTQIDLIFDASGSMWGQIDGKCKIEIARKALNDLLDEFKTKKNIYLGLRVYGHLNKKCSNSVLEIKIGKNNIDKIKEKVNSINPKGKTPIAYSLLQAINDFDKNIKSGDRIIILITDGIESCEGNACKVAQKLKKEGIITNLHVVGFGMTKKELTSLNCIVKPFNGRIIGASNAKELVNAFKKITKEVTNKKNLSVIGLDKNNKKVYMDVDILQNDNKVITSEGINPLFSLKEGVYDVVAKSRNSKLIIKKEKIKIEAGKMKELRFIFAEAGIKLKAVNTKGQPIYGFFTIYEHGTKNEIMTTQGNGFVIKTILPGIYDIKVYEQDTYSTIWVNNIEIKAGEIVQKIIKFEMGTIAILPQINTGKISTEYWWYYFYKKNSNKKEKKTAEGVGKKEHEILPGTYSIKVLDGYNKVVKTIDNIVVKKGKRVEVKVIVNK